DGIDGAGSHGTRPGKAPETSDARLVDGNDGDVVRQRKPAASLHQPVVRVALDPRRAPVDEHPQHRGESDDGGNPKSVAATVLHFPQLMAIRKPSEGHLVPAT